MLIKEGKHGCLLKLYDTLDGRWKNMVAILYPLTIYYSSWTKQYVSLSLNFWATNLFKKEKVIDYFA